ncbi:facilitated trehalose transporter Tret1-2 homolog [Condylostylus longicornis]|uniref:facilitated trehalose transporter Tret1-2 homolog n=1 Tax=Condylostylus longicornis TaxID=2530218 RepID=UPI00244E3230|nr:facilitated trehalose transporter Tret1-2 homolog [Condylostylus longicornis]
MKQNINIVEVEASDLKLIPLEEKCSTITGSKSSKKGIFNQILVTGVMLIYAAACGMPIGYSAILLPQLYNTTGELAIDIEMGSWIASIHSLATPIGSFTSGPLSDRFGRKTILLFNTIPLLCGWISMAMAQSHIMLLGGRLLAGFAVGVAGPPAQILLAEIADQNIRGAIIGAPFVSYSIGILLIYTLGLFLNWRTAAWYATILPILTGITILFIPESPTWLIRNGKSEKAKKTLSWIRMDPFAAEQDFSNLVKRFESEKKNLLKENDAMSTNFLNTLCKREVVIPFLIINIFNFLIIFSGTYLIIFYAIDIFIDIGGNISTMQAAIITALVRILCTFIFCFLLFVLKRKTIIISSGIGSGISSLLLSVFTLDKFWNSSSQAYSTYILAACIVVYIAFNTSFMVMPGIMIGELLPSKVRGQIAGYIFALAHISTFLVAKLFPRIKQSVKINGLFLIFGIASFLLALVMFLILPEAKGKTLEEIEDEFKFFKFIWSKENKKNKANEESQNLSKE